MTNSSLNVKRWRILNKDWYKEYTKQYHRRSYVKENIKKWRKENPDKVKKMRKKAHLKAEYNITLEYYENLLKQQKYKCAICFNKEIALDSLGNIRPLNIDHCHKTNKVRGLLCLVCNLGLGKFKDNIKILKQAINYLKGKRK